MSFAGRSVSNGSAASSRGPAAKPPLAMSNNAYNPTATPAAAVPAFNRTPSTNNPAVSNPLELDIFSPARTPIANSNGMSRSALAMNPSLQQQYQPQQQQQYSAYSSAAHARTSSMTAAVISPPHSPQPTDTDTAMQVLPAALNTAATAKTISTTYKPSAAQAPSSAQLTSSASPIDDWTHVSPQSAPIASDPAAAVKASVKPNAWQTRQQQQSQAPPPPLPRQQSASSQRATSTPSTALAIIPQAQTQVAPQHKQPIADIVTNGSSSSPPPALQSPTVVDLSTFDVQLQRLVTTIDTRLADSHDSIRQDVAGLHVELIRQFHMHEQQTASQLSAFMGEFRELLKECKALRDENRIWRERYG